MRYKEHTIEEFDEVNLTQTCIVCGEVIMDFRELNTVAPEFKWPAGKVYENLNGLKFYTTRISDGDEIIPCAAPGSEVIETTVTVFESPAYQDEVKNVDPEVFDKGLKNVIADMKANRRP